MNKLIKFEISGLAFCWKWKVFPPPPESPFYYLSRVWVMRISPNKKRFLKTKTSFSQPRISPNKLKTKTFFSAKDFSQQKIYSSKKSIAQNKSIAKNFSPTKKSIVQKNLKPKQSQAKMFQSQKISAQKIFFSLTTNLSSL